MLLKVGVTTGPAVVMMAGTHLPRMYVLRYLPVPVICVKVASCAFELSRCKVAPPAPWGDMNFLPGIDLLKWPVGV